MKTFNGVEEMNAEMTELILFSGAVYIDNKHLSKDEICKIVARRFCLFSETHQYPLWLARIVEWTINDVEDGTFIHGGYSGNWP